MSHLTTKEACILIVDDKPTNLGFLFDFLAASGFKVLVARDGESAVQKVAYALPDLILLDVIMPGIDGFETCRRLKANESTKDTPVIFMTALSDTVDKVTGLNLGAVDYITKPLQHEEVLARVNIHLSMRTLTKKLQEQNVRLEQEIKERVFAEEALLKLKSELEIRVETRTAALSQSNELLKQEIQERLCAEAALQQSEAQLRTQTQQLEQALHSLKQTQAQLVQREKMSSLGQLVAGIAHEINNPVNFIYGNLDHAQDYTQDLLNLLNLYQQKLPDPGTEIPENIKAIDLEFLREDLPKLLSSMKLGADRIRKIVLSLRTFSRVDEAQMKPVNIHDGIESTLLILHNRLKASANNSGIQVIKEYCPLPPVECYAGQLNQVFMNLLANAIDALEELKGEGSNQSSNLQPAKEQLSTQELPLIGNPQSFIRIRTEVIDNGKVAICIADNGPGMTEELRAKIFDPFFTTKPTGKGTGLGLSISYQIVVDKHGGQIKCSSAPGQGTEFIIEIPVRQHAQESALVKCL